MTNVERLVRERLDSGGFQSQRDAIEFAAELACAEAKDVPSPDERRGCARALCIGLFGPAWAAADEAQRETWIAMAVDAYVSLKTVRED